MATHTAPTTPVSTWNSPVTSYYLLVVSTSILVILGLAVVLSSTAIPSIVGSGGNAYALFGIQAGALALGLIAAAMGSRLSVGAWRALAPWALLGSVVLLSLVPFIGEEAGGNTNWIRVGAVTVQPSELAKVGLALYLGTVLATFRHELTTWRRIMVPGGIAALVVIGLIMVGRDMGTSLVIGMSVAAAYWVAGVPVRFFTMGAVVGVVLVLIGLAAQPSRGRRIRTWLADECDPLGDCLQSTHSTWALASGGLWGLGPGMSREKWGHLPAADNDFIFAILGEEFGLVGTLLVLCSFGIMAIAINRIVRRHRDRFVQITAAALGAWLIGQAAINIAVVVGFAPVTGRPLPFVSSGGSSLVATLIGMGVLMAFARHEPGAQEALSARPSLVRRSLALVSRGSRG